MLRVLAASIGLRTEAGLQSCMALGFRVEGSGYGSARFWVERWAVVEKPGTIVTIGPQGRYGTYTRMACAHTVGGVVSEHLH